MKKLVALMMAVIMVMPLAACGGSSDGGSTNESKKSSTSELGCEITDYMFTNSIDKVGQFIEDNQLEYDSESGYYKNEYIAIYTNDAMTAIVSAAIIKAGNYTLYNVDVGDEIDRDITTNRLNRNSLPLYTDEGDRIIYAAATGGPAFCIKLDENGLVSFVLYEMRGLDYIASIGDEAEQETTTNITASDIYKTLSTSLFQDSGITGSFTDKALAFIDNHQNLFMGNDPNNESANYFNNEAFEYKKFIKSAENYPLSMIDLYDCGVVDIWEENLEDGTCMTYALVTNYFYDEDIVYFVFAPGSFDIYSGDEVTITGIPLGNGAYEDTSGGTTKCIFIASTNMHLFDDGYYEYEG